MKLKFANLGFDIKTLNTADHSLTAVFSTNDVDRHGEVVDQKSWQLKEFSDNPVVLFSHDHSQPPIGKVIGLGYNADGNLEGTVKFAAEEYEFANTIYQLYAGGYMRAFSVGFSAGEVDVIDGVVTLKNNTLYELSAVSVPANQMALAKSKGLDVSALEAKLAEKKEVKATNIGDVCTLEDGTEGMLQTANGGELQCMPKPKQENAAPVKEEKGAIADEVSAEETMESKYEKMDEVCEVIGALWTVYMDEATPLEAFSELVTETAQLLLQVAANDGADDDAEDATVEASLKELLKKSVSADAAKLFIEKMVEKSKPVAQEVVPVVEVKADKPVIKEEVRTNSTALSIKVETPAVRIVVPTKGQNKAKLINKAIRALLAEKAKI